VTAHGLEERRDGPSAAASWRCDHQHLGSPGLMTLAAAPAGAQPDAAPVQDGVFAVFSRLDRRPRVFALWERSQLVAALQAAAISKLGVRVAGERRGWLVGWCLVWVNVCIPALPSPRLPQKTHSPLTHPNAIAIQTPL